MKPERPMRAADDRGWPWPACERCSRGAVWCNRVLYRRSNEPCANLSARDAPACEQPPERRGGDRPPMPDNDDIQRDGRDEHGLPSRPGRRTGNDQPYSTLGEIARRCRTTPDALALDAHVIRMTRLPVEDSVLRCSVVTAENETPEWALPRN